MQSDPTHNRCVVTFVGHEGPIAEAAFRAIKKATELIDLNQHEGAHPRFGATDVLPFVPLRAEEMPVCVETAQRLARRVAEELGIPVFLYEDAARMPEHKNLAASAARGSRRCARSSAASPRRRRTRARRACTRPPGRSPSARASRSSPSTSTSTPDDLDLAKRIAVEIRERDGGMKCVKAMGLRLEDGAVQVSMNLTDYRVTSMADVVAAIGERATAAGVPIRESEVVGLLPQDALVRLAQSALLRDGLQPRPGPRGPGAGHAAVNPWTQPAPAASSSPGVRLTPLFLTFKEPYHWAGRVDHGSPVVLVEIETDAGITGVGESVSSLAAEGTVAALRCVEPLFAGQPIHDVARLVHEARHLGSFNHLPWYADFVLAGVEMALWDAIGKAAGQPVYRLLGGAVRDEVDYFGFVQGDTTDELVEDARELAAAGYGVIYLKVGRGDEADVRNTAAVREAIGGRRLRVDPNCAWSVPDAIRMIHALEPFGIDWVEQPTTLLSVTAMRQVREAVHVPIAADQAVLTPATSTTSSASARPTPSSSRRTRPVACSPSARPPPSPRPAACRSACTDRACPASPTPPSTTSASARRT